MKARLGFLTLGVFVFFFSLLFTADAVAVASLTFNEEKILWEEHFNRVPDVTVKGSGFKPYNRWAWFYGQRVDESGFVSQGTRWQAYLEMRQIIAEHDLQTGPVWTHLGPANIAGRCQPIVIDPQDHNRILVGSASGGLWQSLNAGESWEPIDDQLPSLAIGAILFDENNPNTVYIGTGEGNNSADAVFGVGVMVSYDRGLSWEILGSGLDWSIGDGKAVNALAMNSANGILLAATTAGVYRFENGVWNQTLAGKATALVRHPSSTNIFYCALGYPFGNTVNGIYKSVDSGETWTELTNGFPVTHGRVGLAISESAPQIIYAGVSKTDGTTLGIYKTTDGGDSWSAVYNSGNHYGLQGWYNLVIAVDPMNPNLVYSDGIDIWRSTNGGVSFSQVSRYSNPVGHPQYVHEDQHGWTFHPDDPNHVYAVGDGGIFESYDNGSTWQEISTGLVTAQFYNIDVAASDPSVAMGGTQDNGTLVFSGAANDWTRALRGDGFHCNIDYMFPDTMYFEQQFGAHRRTYDGGQSVASIMTGIGENGNWNTPVHLDCEDRSVLYTAHRKIYKTIDRGGHWVAKTSSLTGTGVSITQCPVYPKALYVAFSAFRSIYRSMNKGETWIAAGASGLPDRAITCVKAHPTDSWNLFVATSGFASPNIWKSGDGGETFLSIHGNLPAIPVNTIEVDPENPSKIYIGTDLGVWWSESGGDVWLPYGTGLPNTVVSDLCILDRGRMLRAGTYGRGLWEVPLNGNGAVAVQESGDRNSFGIVSVFPNPLGTDELSVRFGVEEPNRVRVQLFDVSGRLIEAPLDRELGAGIHAVTWQTHAVNGVYFVKVREGQKVSVGKIIIQR